MIQSQSQSRFDRGVEKPSRYLGGEINAVVKNDPDVDLHVALAFPDVYEIGMSHVGLRILYGLINQRPEYWAERVMAVWPDQEARLRADGRPLSSLESGRPLQGFDVAGFSLQYELSYANILNMLDMGGVPVLAADRGDADPMVIGGGPNATNPEPLADFFDLFFMGDAEAGFMELLDDIARFKAAGASRREILEAAADRPGVYVPSFFEPVYERGRLIETVPLKPGYERVFRAVSPDLNQAFYPDCPVTPFTQLIHDRAAVEISRGCTRGCRFCQAGFIYRPVREREPAEVLRLAEAGLKATGYNEASFLSLSAGDYTALSRAMSAFMDRFEPEKIALALPSLRVKSMNPEMMNQIKRVRKTGFTIAPEAGSQRLRDVINKDLTEDDLLSAVKNAFSLGWRLVKLYFMIGLPTETDEDVEAIADLAAFCAAGVRGRINVSHAVFVPKPHTPFQWAPMLDRPEMNRRMDLLRRRLKKPRLQAKWNDVDSSWLEGIFSRGDRRLAPVIRRAAAAGARFDAWSDQLNLKRWEDALAAEGLDPDDYLGERPLDAPLPWSHLNAGVSRDYLLRERARALAGEATPDCRQGDCRGCGACDFKDLAPRLSRDNGPIRLEAPRFVDGPAARVWVGFAKQGPARWLSQLETMTVFLRAFRRAGVRVRMSQGFNPQPRLTFADALPVGVAGRDEYLEVTVLGAWSMTELKGALDRQMPEGFIINAVHPVTDPKRKLKVAASRYRVTVETDLFQEARLEESLSREALWVTKKSKRGFKDVDLKSILADVKILTSKQVELTLKNGPQGPLRPIPAVCALFGLDRLGPASADVVKIKTFLESDPCPPS